MKLCIIVGTRPEIIKLAPVIKECENALFDFFIVHSNQHYSKEMDAIFFDELRLPEPKYNLNVGSGKHGNQTGNILIKLEPILEQEKPDIVLVQGDTNTVLAGAMAAQKLGIQVAHLEAGLRSYDRTMPEETNRVIVDHIADYMFAVSKIQKEILLAEGCDPKKIYVTGNSIVDALKANIGIANEKSKILEKLQIKRNEYFLLTAHRSSNVDYKDNLVKLIEILKVVCAKFQKTIVWPMHPRTRKTLETFGIHLPSSVLAIEPLGYLDFLQLTSNAKIVLTDSGGVQEESCILGVPCVTLRENTERPETINVGANRLVGLDKKLALEAIEFFNDLPQKWSNPFGDGTTASQVVDVLFGRLPASVKRRKKIAVIGLGYMGLPMACLLNSAGYEVAGVDINAEKVANLNKAICPFKERGMEQLLQMAMKKGFKAYTSIPKSDVYLISVPTPSENTICDLSFVEKAFADVLEVAENGSLIIVESTIKPRTCLDILLPKIEASGKNLLLAHCPERAIPGNTLYELQNNDRVVGGIDDVSAEMAHEIYSSFCKGEVIKTDVTTAECVKLVENTFRDINIAFANELDEILHELNVNTWEVIRIANHHPRVNILAPGPGVGGHCIAVDPWFLVEDTKTGNFIRAARQINDRRPSVIIERARLLASRFGPKVGILGLAYKKNVDDYRESPSIELVHLAKKQGWHVRAADPLLIEGDANLPIGLDSPEVLNEWADFIILATDHDIFKNYQFTKPILDTRNFFK